MNPFGYPVKGCRDKKMSVIAPADPHAALKNVYDAHPDGIFSNRLAGCGIC